MHIYIKAYLVFGCVWLRGSKDVGAIRNYRLEGTRPEDNYVGKVTGSEERAKKAFQIINKILGESKILPVTKELKPYNGSSMSWMPDELL